MARILQILDKIPEKSAASLHPIIQDLFYEPTYFFYEPTYFVMC
jgi:hypothetical protein